MKFIIISIGVFIMGSTTQQQGRRGGLFFFVSLDPTSRDTLDVLFLLFRFFFLFSACFLLLFFRFFFQLRVSLLFQFFFFRYEELLRDARRRNKAHTKKTQITQTHAEIYHTKIAEKTVCRFHAVFTFKPILSLHILVYFFSLQE
jgi:asparagine N-glycosylation enzyme membrane subunit Stt3